MTLPDDDLLARLRALPDERRPPDDSWQQLAARLPPRQPQQAAVFAPQPVRQHRRWRRWSLPLGAALAASAALYGVLPGLRDVPEQAPMTAAAPTALEVQAHALAEQYQQAVETLPSAQAPQWQPALNELDRSARQINAALAESPGSRYLLDQLQRTYALRLELTRQAAQVASRQPS